jgi:hypothetical protein
MKRTLAFAALGSMLVMITRGTSSYGPGRSESTSTR